MRAGCIQHSLEVLFRRSSHGSQQNATLGRRAIQQLFLIGWVSAIQLSDLSGQRQLDGRKQACFSRTIFAMHNHDLCVERRIDLAPYAAEIFDVDTLEDEVAHDGSSLGSE